MTSMTHEEFSITQLRFNTKYLLALLFYTPLSPPPENRKKDLLLILLRNIFLLYLYDSTRAKPCLLS